MLNKRPNTVALLLSRHADPNQTDMLGQTAAHLAVATNQPTMLSWLVRYGADISLQDQMGHDPLDLAATEQRPKVARMLLKQNGPQQLTENSAQLLLAQAVANGNAGMVSLLLNAGVNPNVPLDKVVDLEKKLPDWLNDHTLAPSLKKDRDISLLMLAAAAGRLGIVEKLLKSGADVEARTQRCGHSALDMASESGHDDVARRLLGMGGKNPQIAVRIFLGRQKATLYMKGKEWMTTRISTGRRGFRTPTGSYVVTNKHREWVSNLYDAPMPYFLRLNYGSIGLHAGIVPGYPASHGCIRLPYNAAQRFFEKVPVGTLVSIEP
ncbi:MAG: ankyrin repeat domain-containing protein [bacterium]